MADRIDAGTRSRNMQRIRSTGMKPELAVRKMLHSVGYRYRLHRNDLPGRPDIVFPSRQKIVFVHGCYWHQHLGCKLAHRPKSNLAYWEKKLKRNQERDVTNRIALEQLGWKSIIAWECEIVAAPEKVLARLKRFLG